MAAVRTSDPTYCLVLFGRNVLQQGLHDSFILPDSEHYDAVLCSATADVDMDGRNEVVLGTYGQVRLNLILR
jgi:hypothetical protein